MTDGGGTVAGESPDRSEQRKPSGGTANGGADPRLAMADRSDASDTPDTTDAPDAPEVLARESGTETGSADADRELRSAVAAWVASAGDGRDDGGREGDRDSSAADRTVETAVLPGAAAEETAVLPEIRRRPGKGGETDQADQGATGGEAGKAEGSGDGPAAPGEGKAAAEPDAEAAPDVKDAEPDVKKDEPDVKDAAPDVEPDPDVKKDEPEAGSEPGPAEDDAQETKPVAKATAKAASAAGRVVDHPTTALRTPPAPRAEPDSGAKGAKAAKAAKGAAADKAADKAVEKAPGGTEEDKGGSEGDPAKGVAKDARKDAGKKKDTETDTETDAERTSTFVPLRTDDIRRPAVPRSRNETSGAAPATPGSERSGKTAGAKPEERPGGKKSAEEPVEKPVEEKPGAGKRPEKSGGAAEATGAAATADPERTSQQPLPPLDLLAQLTNTPLTPFRAVVRRVKIWTPLVVLLLIVLAVAQVLRPLPAPELKLSGDPAFTFKGDAVDLKFPGEGQGAVAVDGVGTVATYGDQKPRPIASVTKAMTAYVILREKPLTGKGQGDRITIDQRTEDEYHSGKNSESVVEVKAGQKYTQRQLLELLMIPSANNVARLLARWHAGSEAAFVKKMQAAADDLGMKDTVYTDPSGLRSTTVSTPLDQLKLAEAAMQDEVFREIVNTTKLKVPGIERTIYNSADKALLLDGVGGIKTGSSTPAGGNLLWSANAEVDGEIHRVYGATFDVHDAGRLDEKLELAVDHSIRVIEAAQQAVTSDTVIKKGTVVGRVDDGLGGTTPVVATEDLKAIGWAGHRAEISIDGAGSPVPGTGAAGDVVGRITVGTGEGRLTAPVALQRELVEPGVLDKLTRIG
ncbi:D-alanyl-D-alanine carboxypeptidase [Streptomyces clavuligerus]|uniref:D-alanyl-D-alanine carboxypeptidase n=1 Tax=Streptomyces clavuligerus TaxID=1901 RepID=E2Q169_STRCL|nr:serine hydrolase [Streptomyces clavuligerus]EFG08574.1 D-alanyl-D-alanine carboxypeptidase [Streptomyces clavuligerus]WDN53394.1 D-alanyl-D-alanine carboxypeptidase [Streptomyces clavuligerus]